MAKKRFLRVSADDRPATPATNQRLSLFQEVAIARLAAEAAANLDIVMTTGDEVMPVVTLCAQIFNLADELRVPVSSKARTLLERAISVIGPRAGALLRVAAHQSPTADNLLEWIRMSEAARYAEDAAYDIHLLDRGAARLLATEEAERNAYVAAFAAELRTDHGVALPQVGTVEDGIRPRWLPESIDEPGRFAADLSLRGVTVSLLALDERKRLVRISAQAGKLLDVVYETDAVFSAVRLEEWAKEFPYGYGKDRKYVGDLFYSSMRGLGLTMPACERLVLVMGTTLQQLPPSLLLVNDQFIGRSTRIAVALQSPGSMPRSGRNGSGETLRRRGSLPPSRTGAEVLLPCSQRD